MKTGLMMVLALFGVLNSSFAQQSTPWDKWEWLLGEWVGEGSGQPGEGGGTFVFAFDLDKKVIVRKSHSEYPASESKPAVIHNDLMIAYLDFKGHPSKAIYFDNEGHIINYTITYADKSIVFMSDKIQNVPIFRLTYTLLENGTINTKFEMSQDGEKFTVYIEGISKKTK